MAKIQETRPDKFGRPTVLIKVVDKKGSGYGKGYLEIGSRVYMVEVSEGRKQTAAGHDVTHWVKLTEMKKNGGRY